MQQLLSEKDNYTNATFIEFFFQCLPSNVHMVLASSPDTENIEELAQLADKVMEVAVPSVVIVNTNIELEWLCEEVVGLKSMLQALKLPQ